MPRIIHRHIESELVRNTTLTIPEGIVPDHEQFIVNALKALNSNDGEISTTDHGHAAGMLAQVMVSEADIGASPERQRAIVKEAALKLIDKYGVKIVPFLRDELKLALEGLDLTQLNP